MMLLLAAIRRLPFLNGGVRHGLWRDDIPRPPHVSYRRLGILGMGAIGRKVARRALDRSEEHTSELQSLMRISYAVFCLKKKRYSDTKKSTQQSRHHTPNRLHTTTQQKNKTTHNINQKTN